MPHKLPEERWRAFVVGKFECLETRMLEMHNANVATLARIETQTRLARNMQDISKASVLIYRLTACLCRVFMRVAIAVLIVYIIGYMVLHDGHVPPIAKELLTLIRRD